MTEMINSYWKTIEKISDLNIEVLFYFWVIENGVKTNNIQSLVISINENIITARKMAVTETILPQSERQLYNISIESLIEKKAKYLYDEINDKAHWPRKLNVAIEILTNLFEERELNQIRNMSWQQFQTNYGGLGVWIRNNFGLWRGNFDLLIDSKIDKINADSASESILYHFWEFIVYDKE